MKNTSTKFKLRAFISISFILFFCSNAFSSAEKCEDDFSNDQITESNKTPDGPIIAQVTPADLKKETNQVAETSQEDADDLFNRGLEAYQRGRGGVSLIQKAAELGHAQAQNAFGIIKEERETSDEEAFGWYKMSAEQGYAPAQVNLGRIYLNRMNRKKKLAKTSEEALEDLDQAIYWVQKALDQGDDRHVARFLKGLIEKKIIFDEQEQYRQKFKKTSNQDL